MIAGAGLLASCAPAPISPTASSVPTSPTASSSVAATATTTATSRFPFSSPGVVDSQAFSTALNQALSTITTVTFTTTQGAAKTVTLADFTNASDHKLYSSTTGTGVDQEVLVQGEQAWSRTGNAPWDSTTPPVTALSELTRGAEIFDRVELIDAATRTFRITLKPSAGANSSLELTVDEAMRPVSLTTSPEASTTTFEKYGQPVEIPVAG